MQKPVSILLGLLTTTVVAGAVIAFPRTPLQLDKYNLIGTLSKIASTNGKLGNINNGLLNSLNHVNAASSYTSQANDKLSTLQVGLDKQINRLEDLRSVSVQQVQLGTKLNSISKDLVKTLSSVDSTSALQLQKMNSLVTVAKNLSQTFNSVNKINQDTNSKIKQAALLSQQADRELP